MTIRTPLAAAIALVLVAAATPSASAQQVVHSTPVVYHQPIYTYSTPTMVQSGGWYNRPIFGVPESNRPLSRPVWAAAGRDGFGVPFNNRPGLNIAYRLAWR
jgi:hypothetical protein